MQQTALKDKYNTQLMPAPWLPSCSCAATPGPCAFSCSSLSTCSWQQLQSCSRPL